MHPVDPNPNAKWQFIGILAFVLVGVGLGSLVVMRFEKPAFKDHALGHPAAQRLQTNGSVITNLHP